MRRASTSAATAAALLLAAGCAGLRGGGAQQGRAGKDEGMLAYTVGRLSFEAPAGWRAEGDARRVQLASPAGDGRIEARVSERTFPDDKACLAQAEDSLARGAARFTNVRRHATTLGARRAVVQEADQEGWHGWAWAVCDRGEQYRLSFTGRSPLGPEAVRASRVLPVSVAIATGGPGA